MEKENVKLIFESQSVDSKAVASKRGASVLDAVPATNDAAGASAASAGRGQIPPEWDPYEEVSYIRPPNPYDTCIADPWTEVTRVCSPCSSPIPISTLFLQLVVGSLVNISADL